VDDHECVQLLQPHHRRAHPPSRVQRRLPRRLLVSLNHSQQSPRPLSPPFPLLPHLARFVSSWESAKTSSVYVAGRGDGYNYDKYATREEAQGLLGCGNADLNKINGL